MNTNDMKTIISLVPCAFIALGCASPNVASHTTGPATPHARSAPRDAEATPWSAPPGEAGERGEDDAPKGPVLPPELPATCPQPGDADGDCTPGVRFAEWICKQQRPSAALAMFAKGTPWKRAYLTHPTTAWHASVRSLKNEVQMNLHEEVVIVRHHKEGPTGIVFTYANGLKGSYDVVRWDGTCVSLQADELTFARPPVPRRPPVDWTRLDDGLKEALSGAPLVQRSLAAVDSVCDREGDRSELCRRTQRKLNAAVVEVVLTSDKLVSTPASG